MKALVTGATGLVGSHLVECLLTQQPAWQVRVLVRPKSRDQIQKDGVEIALGDLTEASSLQPAVQGIDTVFHCAAFVSDWASREEMVRINVEGLRHLLQASLDAGVRRVVVVSSMAVLGMDRQDNLDEDAPYIYTGDLYNYTKIEGEKLALEFFKAKGLQVTVVRPPYIYGPRDRQMMPRLLSALKEGQFMHIDGGKHPFNLVYVGNLVQAMLLAAKNDKAVGQVYHVTDGVAITRKELLDSIADQLGCEKPVKSVPLGVAKVVCSAMELAVKVFKSRKTPLLNKFRLKFLSTPLTFDIRKVKSDLGYVPRPQRECLDETLRWYADQQRISVKSS